MMNAELRATVTRGPESWQFFAFVFAAVATLGLSLVDDLLIASPWQAIAKVAHFLLCFYIFMRNAWVRNKLVGFLTWVKWEEQGRIA